jgi:hypothetical protein
VSLIDRIHSITGVLSQRPLYGVPYTALVPDDYLPQPDDFHEGTVGVYLAAAAGFRTELAFYCNSLDQKLAIEISDLRVQTGSAGYVDGGFNTTALGGTFAASAQSPFPYADWTSRIKRASLLACLLSNGAAATTVTYLFRFMATSGVAGESTVVPGRFVLRGGTNGALLLRPQVDNKSLTVSFRFRRLEKRSL